MYSNTRFSEILNALPRQHFNKAVSQHKSDYRAKGFSTWDQLLAMIFVQISGCQSLREVEAGFNHHTAQHYHLGTRKLKRSTLSDANANRSSEVFGDICSLLLEQAHRKVRSELKDVLYLIDSTPIPLNGLGYDDWASKDNNGRSRGLKVHTVLAPDVDTPVRIDITAPNVNDVEIGKKTPLEAGATYVFDKAYCDYNWWYSMSEAGSYFVSRFKKNAGIKRVKDHDIPESDQAFILEDSTVTFKNKRPGSKRINRHYDTPLRRIVVNRPDKSFPMVLVTNDFTRSATEIAELYKRRWGIELFFKWLKQNLKIKRFIGRSKNAVKTQIYTALITYLLILICHETHKVTMSLKLFIVELKLSLFQRLETERYRERRRRKAQLECERHQMAFAL